MADTTYAGKIAVGGVWPGFDDTLASWGRERYIWRRCGQTWQYTWSLAEEYNPPIVMIDTWNDFEEGTDIEYGIGECLTSPQTKCASPGEQVVYQHTVFNSAKFTDTFQVQTASSNAWSTVADPSSVLLPGHVSASLVVTLTVPETIGFCTKDILIVTATSELSAAVHSTVVDTTRMSDCIYLPIIIGNQCDLGCQVSIDPASPTENDNIQLAASGEWPDGCPPSYLSHQVVDNIIRVNAVLDYPPGTNCPAVITPWSFAVDVGNLAQGVYSVELHIETCLCATESFSVLTSSTAWASPSSVDRSKLR
jgi:hypothetical protein